MLRPVRRPLIPTWILHYHHHHHQPPFLSLFHCTTSHGQPETTTNHYETLQISPTSTTAQIKSQFYTLSKSYHPDHNRHDPKAANRFVQISEAYAVLGSPAKRERYDRDLQRSSSSSSFPPSSRNGGQTTTGPAGGRPASGLSRRRTQFKGPPPSFYRSGGWGAQYAKRAQAQGAQTSGNTGGGGGSSSSRSRDSYAAAAGFNDDFNDVLHFDRDAHFRTHLSHEERWRQLRRRRMNTMAGGGARGGTDGEQQHHLGGGGGGSLWASFFFVGGIVAFVVGLPTVLGATVGGGGSGDVFPGTGPGKRKGGTQGGG